MSSSHKVHYGKKETRRIGKFTVTSMINTELDIFSSVEDQRDVHKFQDIYVFKIETAKLPKNMDEIKKFVELLKAKDQNELDKIGYVFMAPDHQEKDFVMALELFINTPAPKAPFSTRGSRTP